MLKKLRIKFICMLMVVITIMLCFIFGLVIHFTRLAMESQSIQVMHSIADNPFALRQPENTGGSEQVQLPFFAVQIGRRGELEVSGNSYYDLSDEDAVLKITLLALDAEDQVGVLSEYGLRFLKTNSPGRQRIVFADMSSEKAAIANLMRSCAFVGSLSLLAFLGISILLAHWAVKPVDQAWKQQKQFVADASHELKTPLTSIRLLSDSILQDPEMEPELIREFVGDIGREAQRLSRITEGLLSLTQLDRGIQEQSGVIDVSGQVRYAIHLLLPLAEAKDIVLHSQLESNCLVLISVDNMAHIANNLIENAIKYNTPGGSVWIRLAIIQEDVVFTVEDTGIGIPPEEREKVFERFYRVDKARSREAGGTGLGLSIVHDTVLQAGGSIRLTEGCAGGACFQVTLPLAREESA